MMKQHLHISCHKVRETVYFTVQAYSIGIYCISLFHRHLLCRRKSNIRNFSALWDCVINRIQQRSREMKSELKTNISNRSQLDKLDYERRKAAAQDRPIFSSLIKCISVGFLEANVCYFVCHPSESNTFLKLCSAGATMSARCISENRFL